jgi:uncharacterized glyoxalase superfamily protein PhnB
MASLVFKKLTPNLIVSNVERSVEFYRTVLGFEFAFGVPEQEPRVFAAVMRDGLEIFFNLPDPASEDYPDLRDRTAGGGLTQFIEVEGGIDELYASVSGKARVVMPIKDQFYGMREFAIADPDGWLLTFAERRT